MEGDSMEDETVGESTTDLKDYGHYFVTNEVFSTRDDMINWTRQVAKSIGFVVVIMRSDSGGSGFHRKRREFLTLGCERSGSYHPYKTELKRQVTGTKKLDCPFRLRGRPNGDEGRWNIIVKCGKHNHPSAETLLGHPYPGRLKPEEEKLVIDMTKINVKPGKILHTIKQRDPENLTTIKGIYNARVAYNKSIRASRTEMQHLMLMLEEKGFHHRHRIDDGSDVVKDIFWAYKESIKLFHTFLSIILVDATYKTCRYKLPLVDIVGVTSTNLTFAIAYAYMESERTDNYVWALQCLKDLIIHDDGCPEVIVSDRDLALLNAINVVFPNAKHLLCQYHIEKCVESKLKLQVAKKDSWKKMMSAWNSIVDSATEEEYESRVKELDTLCHRFWDFRDYYHATWLTPHKERFVHACIDKVMHLGNTTTNRTEGHHGKLKRLLTDSQGDFCKALDRMHKLITCQITEIMSSFQQSIIITEHRFNIKLYSKLRGLVSRHCLQEIHAEHHKSLDLGTDKSKCGCVIRSTHGIPCACQISSNRAIELHEIHPHWRRLAIRKDPEPQSEPSDEVDAMRVAVDGLWNRFLGLDIAGRNATIIQVNEIGHPESTSMNPPMHKVIKKENMSRKSWKKEQSNKRNPSFFEVVDSQVDNNASDGHNMGSKTKKSKGLLFAAELPHAYATFIDEVVNVVDDGNCGYRVFSKHVFHTEDCWGLVRGHCHQELVFNWVLYCEMFGEVRCQQLLASSIADPTTSFQPMHKWITLPDMGYVLANSYQRPVVSIAKTGSCTIFPLTWGILTDDLIGIAFVSGCHFVQLKLRKDCPLPPITLQWSTYASEIARPWKEWHARRNLSYVPPQSQCVPHSF